jgi:hypothetical protein
MAHFIPVTQSVPEGSLRRDRNIVLNADHIWMVAPDDENPDMVRAMRTDAPGSSVLLAMSIEDAVRVFA